MFRWVGTRILCVKCGGPKELTGAGGKWEKYRCRPCYRAVCKVKSDKRRALEQNAEGSYTAEEWLELCEKQDWKCIDCGKEDKNMTVGHALPLSKGGSNYISNIIGQCLPCNLKQHTNIHWSITLKEEL